MVPHCSDFLMLWHIRNCQCYYNYCCTLQGNENYTGIAARDTANSLRVLTSAVRGVAATSSDRELQDSIIDHARDVMDKSANLIEEAKKAVMHPQNPDNQTRLAQVNDEMRNDVFLELSHSN